MRTCIRLSLLALLLAAGLALPRAARAAPDEEKLTLDGADTMTNGPMAAAVYEPLGFLVVANHDSDTVSLFELPAMAPILDGAGDPLTLSVVDQPVAIAIWDDASVMQPTPTVAYAFVAGYGDSAISVIDLFAEPPVVLTDREIDLTLDEDINAPGPTALAVMGDELFVATQGDGTVMRYDITDLPGATPAHVGFPVNATDRTSNAGNAIVCTETTTVSPSGAKPRALTVFGGFLWAGCTNGGVSQISPSDGAVTLILDTLNGSDQVAALAPDPRGDSELLYVLDDGPSGERGIYALDFTGGTLADPAFIENICDQGSSQRRSIPVATGNATAMVPYNDPSDGTDWLVVLSTSSTGSNLTLVNVASIDPEGSVPECALDAEDGISFTVPLTLGDPVFPISTTPNELSQQIGVFLSYIAVPNYGATGGTDMVSLVTDAALIEEAGPMTLAFGYNDGDAMTEEDNNVKTQVDLQFTTDEDIPTPIGMQFAFVRLKGELAGTDLTPLSVTYAMPDLTIPISAESVRTALGLATTDNEFVEVLLLIPDESDDVAYVSREVIYDTTDPQIVQPGNVPLEGTVGVGSNELTVTIPGASDVEANSVASGVGSFFVEFTMAVDAENMMVTPPGDQAYASGNGASFTITGLTNRVTYTFTVYALDNAGNRSVEMVPDLQGTPAPGVSLLDLLGENGCVFSPRARGWGAGELLLWLGAFAIALAVRRRGVRA